MPEMFPTNIFFELNINHVLIWELCLHLKNWMDLTTCVRTKRVQWRHITQHVLYAWAPSWTFSKYMQSCTLLRSTSCMTWKIKVNFRWGFLIEWLPGKCYLKGAFSCDCGDLSKNYRWRFMWSMCRNLQTIAWSSTGWWFCVCVCVLQTDLRRFQTMIRVPVSAEDKVEVMASISARSSSWDLKREYCRMSLRLASCSFFTESKATVKKNWW